jgi:RNA polymerase sigma-70 factor (ECF subfamily)
MSDNKKLIENCRNGDIHSFELLIESHQKKIYNLAFRMMGNYEDASDVAQEVFIKVYRSIYSFKESSSFSTWIYRIAVNVCLDQLRKKKKERVISMNSRVVLGGTEMELQFEDTGIGPQEAVERTETKQSIARAINNLNEDHKIAIILRDINGYSYEEIAQMLKCSLGTVKSRISRARHSLKDILLTEKEQFS